MAVNWAKIKRKYINSNLSTREIAKLYGCSAHSVADKCHDENWVQLRKEKQEKTEAKIQEKIDSKIIDKESDLIVKAREVNDALMTATLEAVKEIGTTTLHHKRQRKESYKEGNKKIEDSMVKETLETVESSVNLEKLKDISAALRNIIEINALTGGGGVKASKAFDELVKAIGGESGA